MTTHYEFAHRCMGMMNGLLGIVNKQPECSAVIVPRILCTLIVRRFFLGRRIALSSWLIRYCVSSAGNGLDILMISCLKIVITSVMYSVTGLVCQNSQVKFIIWESGCVFVLVLKAYVVVWALSLYRLGESLCSCWRHSLGSCRKHSNAGGFSFILIYLNAAFLVLKSCELGCCR